MPSPEVAPSRRRWPPFDVHPYARSGLSIRGAALLSAVVLAALPVGALAAIVGERFYLIVLFPVLMALAVGGVGWWVTLRLRMAVPWLNVAAGALAGMLVVFSMHYVTYLQFERELVGVDEEVRHLARNLPEFEARLAAGELSPGEGELVESMRADPVFAEALVVESFRDFMRWHAAGGVVVGPAAQAFADADDGGVNLGGIGTWIYWVVELGLVGVLVAGIMHMAATGGLVCSRCRQPKAFRGLGAVDGSLEVAGSALDSGDVGRLHAMLAEATRADHFLCIYRCERCRDAAPIEAVLGEAVAVTASPDQGVVTRKWTVAYPGEAWAAFEELIPDMPDAGMKPNPGAVPRSDDTA